MTGRALIWSQHSLGLGHLTRTLALAGALAESFGVVVASGGLLPPGTAVPRGVDVRCVETVEADTAFALSGTGDRGDVRAVLSRRRRSLLAHVGEVQPDVLVLELFPFGRRRFRGEVEALIAAARRLNPAVVVVSSVRDILVSGRARQAKQDSWALGVANASLDAVLVHADPAVASFGESFPHLRDLRPPVHHTGFVVAPRQGPAQGRPDEVVVSVGGGRVGADLLATAIDAQREPALEGLRMRVVGGPLMPDEDWAALVARARGVPNLVLVRSVPDLRALLAGAAASVSQCGYNTTLEVLSEGTPAVVVPFRTAREDEQSRRAARLASLGALVALEPDEATPARLANAIRDAMARGRGTPRLALDGATRSADIVAGLVRGGERVAA